jgi:hypothetical protein
MAQISRCVSCFAKEIVCFFPVLQLLLIVGVPVPLCQKIPVAESIALYQCLYCLN